MSFPEADSLFYPGIITFVGAVSDAESPAEALAASCDDEHAGLSFRATISADGTATCVSDTGLPENEYYFKLSVVDPAGATAQSAERHFSVYDSPPSVEIEAPVSGTVGYTQATPVTFVAHVADTDQPAEVPLVCSWTSDDIVIGTATVDPSSQRCTLSNVKLTSGTHTILVSVTDEFGKLATSTISLPIKACSDSDGDGYASDCEPKDCNDSDAGSHPGAEEVCDGRDNDCSGVSDDADDADGDKLNECQGDCDDNDPEVRPLAAEVCDGIDNDCDEHIDDGFDEDHDGFSACDPDGGPVDCDDADAEVNPLAVEVCDGVDNDCNGEVDDGAASTWYADDDGDGYGDPAGGVQACTQPEGTVTNAQDCDDTDSGVNPGGTETCDGEDDDCNGTVDEDTTPKTFYQDQDGDGYGVAGGSTRQGCVPPTGYAELTGDCDDADAQVNPGAPEVCDAIDNDCDSEVDEGVLLTFYPDEDGDGYGTSSDTETGCTAPDGYAPASGDCDDADSELHPNMTESCDGIDNNCNGEIDDEVSDTLYYRDADGDGYGSDVDTRLDCSSPAGYVLQGGDCDDSEASINPLGSETCDGEDDDCDGTIDEGVQSTYWPDNDGDGYGDLAGSVRLACSAPAGYVADDTDCDDANVKTYPGAVELCDGEDNDCDEVIDDGLNQVAFYIDRDADGFGDADSSQYACAAPSGYVADASDCNDAEASIHPGATEICDGVDGDCDGTIDEGSDCYDDDGDGYTEREGDCDDASAGVSPVALESSSPDGRDEDCDGVIDEGTSCWDDDGDGFVEATAVAGCPGYPDAYGTLPGSGDCDDSRSDAYPGAPELFNGLDDDCDGSPDGEIPLAANRVILTGDVAGAKAGFTVADLGDVNGDGNGDFAVGAPGRNTNTGAAFVVFGKRTGWSRGSLEDGAVGITLTGEETDSWAGFAVATAGDLDGDGFDDFAVGAPYMSTASFSANGRLYLFYGKSSGWGSGGLDTLRNAYTEGFVSNVLLSYSLAGGGDFNHDGLADLALGGPWPGTPGLGYLMVLPGKGTRYGPASQVDPGYISSSELIKVEGDAGDAIGTAMAFVGRADADEVDDLVIAGLGSTSGPSAMTNAGAVYFVRGSEQYNTAQTPNISDVADGPYRGQQNYEEVGYSVSGAGDIDGDGFEDFLVGREDQGSSSEGLAYLFLGGSFDRGEDDIPLVADAYFTGEVDPCPCTVGGVGDVNVDGLDDFVIGLAGSDLGGAESGAVYLFSGRDRIWSGAISLDEAEAVFVGEPGDKAGFGVSRAGDVNGDGYDDILVGAPGYDSSSGGEAGRVFVLFGFAS